MENLNNVLCFVYCLLSIIISLCIASFLRLNIPNRRKWVISILFLDFIFNLLVVLNVSNVSNTFDRLKLSILYLFVFISFILTIIICLYYNRQIDYTRISRRIMHFSVFLLTISVGYIIVRLMVHKFNDDSWWINENNISDDINKWGDFATFFGGIFALISIYLAYRAFMSQVNASKRTSFDATFTQIFSQHHILHEKVIQYHFISYLWHGRLYRVSTGGKNIFTLCKEEYERSDELVQDFWERFNRIIGSEASIDFKNYFKYIYHEINIVISQPDEVLNDNAKRNYIQLIQAQMNYDELLCYLINQVEYFNYWRNNRNRNIVIYRRAEEHVRNLHDYGFFRELCKNRSERHANLVRRIIGTNGNGCINNDFIDESWFPH